MATGAYADLEGQPVAALLERASLANLQVVAQSEYSDRPVEQIVIQAKKPLTYRQKYYRGVLRPKVVAARQAKYAINC